MNIPNSFNKVSVVQYQQISPILKQLAKEDDGERVMTCWANIIAILTDKQTDDIEDWPLWKLNFYIKQLGWINNPKINAKPRKYVFVNWQLYKATFEMTDFSTSKAIEVITWLKRSKQDHIPEIHNIAASIYSPLKWSGLIPRFKHDGRNHAKHAANFKRLKMGRLYPTVFFYSKIWERYLTATEAYGLNQLKVARAKLDEAWEAIQREILEIDGAGTLQSTS